MKTLDSTKQEIIERLDGLTQAQLEQVLAFVRSLASGGLPAGIPGKELADFFRQHTFTKEEADEMDRILKEMRSGR